MHGFATWFCVVNCNSNDAVLCVFWCYVVGTVKCEGIQRSRLVALKVKLMTSMVNQKNVVVDIVVSASYQGDEI